MEKFDKFLHKKLYLHIQIGLINVCCHKILHLINVSPPFSCHFLHIKSLISLNFGSSQKWMEAGNNKHKKTLKYLRGALNQQF